MAILRINGNVKIGHIYECNFGMFKKNEAPQAGQNQPVTKDKDEAATDDYNYRIPNEMIKKRPVVVIGKHKGQYMVVPISSTKETDKKPAKNPENVGFHILLQPGDMPVTARYVQEKARWAKSNLLMTIDGGRLTDIYDTETDQFVAAHKISDETLLKIRHGVIISIGLRDMLPQPHQETETEAEAPAN